MKAGRPHDRGNAAGREIELGRLLRWLPNRRVLGLGRSLNVTLRDEGVDTAIDAAVNVVGVIQMLTQLGGKAQLAVFDAGGGPVQLHPFESKAAEIQIVTTRPTGNVMIGPFAQLIRILLLVDWQVVVTHLLEPLDDVA